MKKILFLSLLLVVITTTKSFSQSLCSGCAEQATQSPNTFIPQIFNPAPIGVPVEGIAYLKKVPTNSTKFLTAYVYMIGADGKMSEVTILIEMQVGHRLLNWGKRFYQNYYEDPNSSGTYRYITPEPVGFLYEAIPATDDQGNVLMDAQGNVQAIQKIYYRG